MKWLDRLLVSLKLRRPQRQEMRCYTATGWIAESEAKRRTIDARDDDTLPFIRRHAVTIPLSQIPPRPRPAPPHHLRAVEGGRADNAMGDPWVPPGAGGAAAGLVENGEAPAPAAEATIKTGTGGDFGGGGADASWGSSDSGCSSGDSGSSSGCGGSD